MTQLVYARHTACGAELEWRTNFRFVSACPDVDFGQSSKGIYCSACKKFVDRDETTVRGSLAAYREKEHV